MHDKSGRLTLKIITPECVLVDQEVDRVVACAIDGELAILPGHEPLLTALAIDILRYKIGDEEMMAAVMGGVMEVNNNRVTVLADLAEMDAEIDETKAAQDRSRAEAEKSQKADKLDLYMSEMAISRSIARLKAADWSKRKKDSPRQ